MMKPQKILKTKKPVESAEFTEDLDLDGDVEVLTPPTEISPFEKDLRDFIDEHNSVMKVEDENVVPSPSEEKLPMTGKVSPLEADDWFGPDDMEDCFARPGSDDPGVGLDGCPDNWSEEAYDDYLEKLEKRKH